MRLSDAPARYCVLVAMSCGSRVLGYIDSLENPANLLPDDTTSANVVVADTWTPSRWLVHGNALVDYPS
jgi:hypothetical protein